MVLTPHKEVQSFLKRRHFEVEAISYSSDDKKIVMKEVISSLPSSKKIKNVLSIAIAKTSEGYGGIITSHRHISLFDVNKGKKYGTKHLHQLMTGLFQHEFNAVAQKLKKSTLS